MSSPSKKFILRSYDGKFYEIDGLAALQSRMIRDMIDDDSPDDVITVPVPGSILSLVIVYCQKHAEYDRPYSDHVVPRLDKQLFDWDRDFVKLDRLTLDQLVSAAIYLNINGLLNLTCQSIADKIHQDAHGHSPSPERPPKWSERSSAGLSRAGLANSVHIAKIKDTGARRFLFVHNWKGELLRPLQDESTYKVKKMVDTLNNFHVPPPDVLDVVVWLPLFSESVVQSSLRGEFQLAIEILGGYDNKIYPWELYVKAAVEKGISWVIVGHTCRRHLYHESDEIVGDKVEYACRDGLKVIACVGEKGDCQSMDVITAQMKAIAERVSDWENIILAYNPLRLVATSSQAQEVHAGLRRWLHDNVSPQVASTTRIIYGGSSVGDADWEELAIKPDIDGFMVGGVPPKEFTDIIERLIKIRGH